MSIDYETYIGPYARCAVDRADVPEPYVGCSNDACVNAAKSVSSPFCPVCGAKVTTRTRLVPGFAVDAWDVRERISDRLSPPSGDGYYFWTEKQGIHLWLANQHMPGRDFSLESRADFSIAAITPADIEREIAAFAEFFAADLDVLRAVYSGAVSLHWGIVQHYY